MATNLPKQPNLPDGLTLPLHLARPMVGAATAPYLANYIRPLLEGFGFNGLTYLVARDDGLGLGGRIVWSTHAPGWAELYGRARYGAIDPRLANTRHRVTPYLWDAAGCQDRPRVSDFIRDAAQFDIRSGVVIALHDVLTGPVALAFDSGLSPVTETRRRCIAESLGDLMLIAVALHERALSWRITVTPQRRGGVPALTRRERDCLQLAARGMTSADIGHKLSLSERTINFHFGNLRRKLGALNRSEAIAKGAALGILMAD